MSLRKKAIKGAAWSAVGGWGRQLVNFIVFALLARLLEAEDFGLIASASVFTAFLQIFLDQGFSTALIQRKNIEDEHLDTAFWTNLAMGLLLTVICWATADLFSDFYHLPELSPILKFLSLSFSINALSRVQSAILDRNLRFEAQALRAVISVIVGGCVGVSMALLDYHVWSLVGQQISTDLCAVLVLWSASDWRPKLRVSRKHFLELFSYGSHVFGISILNFFNRRSDDLLIGYYLGPIALGYYSIAYRLLLTITNLLINVVNRVALPIFSKIQDKRDKMADAFCKAIRLSGLATMPIFAGMCTFAPDVVEFVFGSQWDASVPVMRILSCIGLVHSLTYFCSTVMLSMGKSAWRLKVSLLNSIFNFLSFLIVVKWGILAVAVAYTVRGYLFLPINLFLTKKLISIDTIQIAKQYSSAIIASLATFLLTVPLRQVLIEFTPFPLQSYVLAYCFAGVVVYVFCVSWLENSVIQDISRSFKKVSS